MTSLGVTSQENQAKNQSSKVGNYFCETIDTQKQSPNESNLDNSFTNNQNRKIDPDNLECYSMQSLKMAGSNGETMSMATELQTPYSGQRVTRMKRTTQDFSGVKDSPCAVKRRSQAAKLCTNPNCTNPREIKKRFANKLGFYCQQCATIIDLDEYCHICLEITSPQEKRWAACDRCKCWNHISCEERLRKGIKNLQSKLENPNYFYICGNCRTSSKKTNAEKMSERMRKMSDATASHTKESFTSKEMAYQNFFELCKMAHQKKKYSAPHSYIYFYSENYQMVDRMVSVLGKRLQLTGDELDDDLQQLFQVDRRLVGGLNPPTTERKKLVVERPVGSMSTRSMALK